MTPDLEHEFIMKGMAHSGLPCYMVCLLQWWIWLWTVASLWPVHQQTHPVVLLPCQQHKERHSLQVYNCQLSQGTQLKRFHSTVCQLVGPQKCSVYFSSRWHLSVRGFSIVVFSSSSIGLMINTSPLDVHVYYVGLTNWISSFLLCCKIIFYTHVTTIEYAVFLQTLKYISNTCTMSIMSEFPLTGVAVLYSMCLQYESSWHSVSMWILCGVLCWQPDSLYNSGMRPCMYSDKEALQNKVGWIRSGQNIKYYRNNLRC